MSPNIASSSIRFAQFCDTNRDVTQSQSPALTTITTDTSIPQTRTEPMAADYALRCCCGRPSCAFLEHNNAALGTLERDLDMAAKMGKVRTYIFI